MKILLPIILLLVGTNAAFGLDDLGYKERLLVKTDGYEFEVTTVSNFEITGHEFDKEQKRVTLFMNSGSDDNLSEIQIPKDLISGNFTFFLNGTEFFPKSLENSKITFITVQFPGKGTYRLDIIGTNYLPEFGMTLLVLVVSVSTILLFKIKKGLFINQ